MYKIAVMGDRDSIYGFASLGLEPFPLTDPAEAGKKVKDLAESGYAVIYITEALAAQIEPEINRYREAGLPAIILIPGISGNTGKVFWQLRSQWSRQLARILYLMGNNNGGKR